MEVPDAMEAKNDFPSKRLSRTKTRTSKELLQLEHSDPSLLTAPKWKLICKGKKKQSLQTSLKNLPLEGLVGENSVLRRVQAFLPKLDEANRKLEEDIKKKGREDYDIEVLKSHGENTYVEMDLALGVADLYSEDAVSAAEKLAGGQIIDKDFSSNEGDLESGSKADDVEVAREKRRRSIIELLP
ncbi:hypothetical protein KP509_15G046300 [Ceratopteris richardii]|uniref:Uncharacterized protein n=1 Tax=Ceratopteris richardii TaxID=49495 RepID=A0A8T2T542_CERRI|nr:hypothetical protein KP509_15G046300 [Ceratopteris richardii]